MKTKLEKSKKVSGAMGALGKNVKFDRFILQAKACKLHDCYDELCKIKAPTLLIWGNLDKETPFYFTKIFKKNIKDCEVIIFEKCGHFAFLEKPHLFLNIIKSFCC